MKAKKKGNPPLKARRGFNWMARAAIEAGSIVFLFYSNLLMGEYTHANSDQGKSLVLAIKDIFTPENFIIAIISALIGYGIFEFLRKRLDS
jgi:hypothetical protein